MALTNNDLQAVRSVIRDETKDSVRRTDIAKFATKADLSALEQRLRTDLASKDDLRQSTRQLRAHLVNKADLKEALAATEGRLSEKIEFETGKIARMVASETIRLRKRDDELARHTGYTFEPETDENA